VDGVDTCPAKPYCVFAKQNPGESRYLPAAGGPARPLFDSVSLGYLSPAERGILRAIVEGLPIGGVSLSAPHGAAGNAARSARRFIHDEVLRYITACRGHRAHESVALGATPGCIALRCFPRPTRPWRAGNCHAGRLKLLAPYVFWTQAAVPGHRRGISAAQVSARRWAELGPVEDWKRGGKPPPGPDENFRHKESSERVGRHLWSPLSLCSFKHRR
jgi:hypothetical protein